jgi:Putative transposase
VPGGGLASDGRWVACRPGFFLPVRVLSRLYRGLFLDRLQAAFDTGDLEFFGDLAPLTEPAAFAGHLKSMRCLKWVVYAKRPFAGPQVVLDYLGRYTHRVAIANGRLLDSTDGRVSFRWKDYRTRSKTKVMSLDPAEFIRRFLMHVLPNGFRRIRHLGFLANFHRSAKLAQIRAALDVPEPAVPPQPTDYRERCARLTGRRLDICPSCGGPMMEVGPWRHPAPPRHSPPRCDTS